MESKPLELGLLRSFSPLDGLKSENLHSLARKTVLRELPAGRLLFKEGDTDKRTFYLVSGVIELLHDDRTVLVIRGGSPEARNPLAPGYPRRYSARVVSDRIEYSSIDSDLLDVMLTWDQTGSYEVSELQSVDDEGAQQRRLDDHAAADQGVSPDSAGEHPGDLHAHAARRLQGRRRRHQAGRRRRLLLRRSSRASALVTRETPLNKDGIKLAELGMGDTFGEEALISDAKRNATVTMLDRRHADAAGKEDFRSCSTSRCCDWVDMEQAAKIVARGGKWLDVRLPSEFENYHAGGRDQHAAVLHPPEAQVARSNMHYVVCCDTGRRSSAAATSSSKRGFRRLVLQGRAESTDARVRRAHAGRPVARERLTSCASACRRRARRRDSSRSCAACCRDPVR